MIEWLVGICLLLLTIGHGMLVHGCMNWTKERRASTSVLDDRLATLATLIDEGLDIFNEVAGDAPASPIAQTPVDLKEMLTMMLMSKMNMAS